MSAAAARVALASRDMWPDLPVGVQYGQRNGMAGADRMASLMVGATLPVFARTRQFRMRDERAAMRAMAARSWTQCARKPWRRRRGARGARPRAPARQSLPDDPAPAGGGGDDVGARVVHRGGVDFMTLVDNRMGVNRYRQELLALDADEGRAWAELERRYRSTAARVTSTDSAATDPGRAP